MEVEQVFRLIDIQLSAKLAKTQDLSEKPDYGLLHALVSRSPS